MGLLALTLCFAAACGGKKSASPKQEKIRAAMSQFFLVVPDPKMPVAGIWVADAASVTAMIEKKYLANYVAKPDEPQANEIRERLKSLKIFFRVEGNSIAMLSIVADSFGVSDGRLTRRSDSRAGAENFDALMRGKQDSQQALVRYRKEKTSERLEYVEGNFTLGALRETRSSSELVDQYASQVRSGTGLTQY